MAGGLLASCRLVRSVPRAHVDGTLSPVGTQDDSGGQRSRGLLERGKGSELVPWRTEGQELRGRKFLEFCHR